MNSCERRAVESIAGGLAMYAAAPDVGARYTFDHSFSRSGQEWTRSTVTVTSEMIDAATGLCADWCAGNYTATVL